MYIFIRFPLKNAEAVVKWENIIGNNWKATKYSRICSKHFLKTDFTNHTNRWLKFNAIPSVFNTSQTAATRPCEQDLNTLVNTLIGAHSMDSSSLQHSITAPFQVDAGTSESVQCPVSNAYHTDGLAAHVATRPCEQDLNTLVNTLIGAHSMDSSSLQHSITAGTSESVQCPVSNAYHTDGLAAHVATRPCEQDLNTLVNTLIGAHSMDSSSLQHSIIAPFQVDAGTSESVQCPVSNAYHTDGLTAHVATRPCEQDPNTLVNTLIGAHSMDSSSLQHSIIAPFQVDAGTSESVQCPVSNAYHTDGLAAHVATRPCEQDLNTLVNTLIGAHSMDSSSLQHSITAGTSESVQCPVSNAYHTDGLTVHVATRPCEQDPNTLVNTLIGAHSMDSSSLQHSIIAPFQVDAGTSESVQCPVSNAYHTDELAAHTDPIVPCKKAKFEKDKSISKKNKKIKLLQQKLRRKNSTISNMKQLIHRLKKRSLINQTEEELLHREFDGMKRSIFKNLLQNSNISPQSRRYTNSIKEFALTLSYYSPKAYAYVRSIMPLPHPSLIRKWARNVNCEPGFIGESFRILEEQAKVNTEKKDCCLVLDAMAIRKQVQWESANNKYSGFVDYGPLEASKVTASEALVFLLVGMRSHWKQPIGYFLTDKATARTQAALINIALAKASSAGLKVWCVTSDGTTTNINTFKKLGCSFGHTYDTILTKFKHPETGEDVFVILDACHMLKLARNALAFLGTISTSEDDQIQWKFFHALNLVQEQEGFKLGNKLSNNHLQLEKHKMNVSLAAQTLSGSVADAIDFMNIVLKQPEFEGSEPTVMFIRTIDRLFDLLNSRNPHGKGFKKPLKLADARTWEATLQSTAKYLLSLKSSEGIPIIKHPRRTFVLGFVISIKSTLEMVKQMLTLPEDPFKYVLTYKYSQDHIEILFSCIRAKGGWNNNPNSLQLKYALRRMLLGNSVQASVNANCQVFDDTVIIPIFRTRKHAAPLAEDSQCPKDDEEEDTDREGGMINDLLKSNPHSEFVQNVLEYISGFVVAKLTKQIKCLSCIANLTESSAAPATRSEHDYFTKPEDKPKQSFLHFLNNGNLKIPSKFVVDVVKYAEHIFKLYITSPTSDQVSNKRNLKTKMIIEICQHFGQVTTNSLPPQHTESTNQPLIEEDHRLWLLKCVANSYLTIRLSTYGKNYTEKVVNFGKPSQRHQLTKLILFNNQ